MDVAYLTLVTNQGEGMADLPCSSGESPPSLQRTKNTWSHSGAALFMTAECVHLREALTLVWWWLNPHHPFNEHPHATLLQIYNIWVSSDVFSIAFGDKKRVFVWMTVTTGRRQCKCPHDRDIGWYWTTPRLQLFRWRFIGRSSYLTAVVFHKSIIMCSLKRGSADEIKQRSGEGRLDLPAARRHS